MGDTLESLKQDLEDLRYSLKQTLSLKDEADNASDNFTLEIARLEREIANLREMIAKLEEEEQW